jgi:hypothetical protein
MVCRYCLLPDHNRRTCPKHKRDFPLNAEMAKEAVEAPVLLMPPAREDAPAPANTYVSTPPQEPSPPGSVGEVERRVDPEILLKFGKIALLHAKLDNYNEAYLAFYLLFKHHFQQPGNGLVITSNVHKRDEDMPYFSGQVRLNALSSSYYNIHFLGEYVGMLFQVRRIKVMFKSTVMLEATLQNPRGI